MTINNQRCSIVIMNTIIQKAVIILGSKIALANKLGVKQQYISNWIHRDKQIPSDFCIPIEKATDCQITCEELRPDIDWAYLRNQHVQQQAKEVI